jgi:uncharacterized membrane-anchored protein
MFRKISLIVFPWVLLALLFLRGILPIVFGKEYTIETYPVDPRDLFKGNYVALSYEFSEVNLSEYETIFEEEVTFEFGKDIYLYHSETEDGKLILKVISDSVQENQKDKVLIKAIVMHSEIDENQTGIENTFLDLHAGIEEYFLPVDLALEAEKAVREQPVMAKLAIDASGNARILDLEYTKLDKPIDL